MSVCAYQSCDVPSQDWGLKGVWGRIFDILRIASWTAKLFVSRGDPIHAEGGIFFGRSREGETGKSIQSHTELARWDLAEDRTPPSRGQVSLRFAWFATDNPTCRFQYLSYSPSL